MKLFACATQADNNPSGFTIIESLMAIIVVAILMTAIAPVIVLSTATRIQARRIEVATQAAKSYINGVNSGNIPLPDVVTTTFDQVPAPTKLENLYCFDVDGGVCGKNPEGQDSNQDLRIQAFRTPGDRKSGFQMGLRVYRNDALKSGNPLKASTADKRVTQKVFTGGLGDVTAPLIELTTDISAANTSFTDFCSRLKNSANTSSECNR
ncbi:prepilin-type N-terminal cleavage/methylation domain-containing protein [Calothrix sp. NIES-3974]|uniref:prepilin-type N-terminal cleavage/methylation domain-containing protein n=1 Tax=Calothrix sp. NIES-3974 TaxID=2005462 RepID=UPI001E609AE4|nr:prepilin-type N-terminal cleavage/methylation domain-containing protein [Calothrix sp. NIES-3974]